MTESDTDLIRRAQANDLDAFCLLAERYARRIHLLALHYCRNAQDAEDLSQEVWLKAYQAPALAERKRKQDHENNHCCGGNRHGNAD